MKISQELFYGFEANFTRRHNIIRRKLGQIFDLDVEGQDQRN